MVGSADMIDDDRALERELASLRSELQRRDALHHRLIVSDSLALLVVDPPSQKVIVASPKAAAFYGCSSGELAGRRLGELIDIQWGSSIAHPLCMETTGIHVHHHHLGKRERHRIHISTWPCWHNGAEATVILMGNAASRTHPQESDARERKFQDLFNTSADILFILEVTADGLPLRVAEANDLACQRLGYHRDELLCMDYRRLHRLVNLQAFRRAMPQWLSAGHATFETSLEAKNGATIHVEVKGSHHAFGDAKAALCIMRDISERRKSEIALRRSEERYRLIPEHSPNGVIFHSSGIVRYASPRALRLLRVEDTTSFASLTVINSTHSNSRAPFRDFLRALEKLDTIAPFEVDIARPDESIITIEAAGAAFTLEGQRTMQLVFRDISERRGELSHAIMRQISRSAKAGRRLPDKLVTEMVYLPAQQMSGDLLFLECLDDQRVVGLIGDGSGKGIAAALNASALRVAFQDNLATCSEPMDMLRHLNALAIDHFGDDYVAACCFCVNLAKSEMTVSSAGVHNFYHDNQTTGLVQRSIAGSSLGMFADSEFDQTVVSIAPGDRIWFFTDGLDSYLSDRDFAAQMASLPSLKEQRQRLVNTLIGRRLDDDCTWLGIEIR